MTTSLLLLYVAAAFTTGLLLGSKLERVDWVQHARSPKQIYKSGQLYEVDLADGWEPEDGDDPRSSEVKPIVDLGRYRDKDVVVFFGWKRGKLAAEAIRAEYGKYPIVRVPEDTIYINTGFRDAFNKVLPHATIVNNLDAAPLWI